MRQPDRNNDVEPLTVVVHELRASLALLNGYLSMLDDVPEGTRREYVATMRLVVADMDRTSEVLVMASRLDAGIMPHAPRAFDARDVVAKAIRLVGPRVDTEHATIDILTPHDPTPIWADPFHVTRIVSNLLHNAVNYSARPAAVTVEVRPGDPVAIAVRDEGVGIPPELRSVVFDPFRRLDGVTPGHGRGLGLGLHISRELATLNGGSLVLEDSEPGKGSTFVLWLPAARAGQSG